MRLIFTFKKPYKIGLFLGLLSFLNLLLAVATNSTAHAAVNPPQLLLQDFNSVYVSNADGSGKRKLFDGSFAEWSPDGLKISYTQSSGNSSSLFVANADGTNPRKISDNVFSNIWSPDSSKLAYTQADNFDAPAKLFVVDASGSNSKQLLNDFTAFGNYGWSPNSQQITFETSIDQDTYSNSTVNIINVDGSGRTKLFSMNNGRLYGYWPDGQRIIFGEILAGEASPGSTETISLVKLDGTAKQTLNTRFLGPVPAGVDIRLSPSGDKVIIATGSGGTGVADVANPITTYKKLLPDGYCSITDWSTQSGKLLTLANINYDTTYLTFTATLDEVDITNGSRRTIARIPPFMPGGQCVTVSLRVEPSGWVTFMSADTFTVNLNTGQVLKISTDDSRYFSSWRPNYYVNTLPEFYRVWQQSDAAIALGKSNRSWLWGPDAFAAKTEDYKEAKDGKRQVQYFDKARMELNNPDGDRGSPFFVTNGLLPKELIGGYIQTGDNQNQPKAPAEINVAGDPNGSITYAKLGGVVTLEPGKNTATNKVGQAVTATIDRNGTVSEKAAVPGVNLAQYISETGHNIPNVFVDYFKTLPQDWVFVMGFPISEPYQTEITLGGKPTLAVIQVFERRVLTYTPSNTDPYKVEQGNVGRHYFQWRYGN